MLMMTLIIETMEQTRLFEHLYETYRHDMYRVAKAVLQDERLAEDAVHEAFIRVMNNLDKVDPDNCHKQKGFLVIITRNVAIDFYNKRKRQGALALDELEWEMADDSRTPEQVGLDNEDFDHLVGQIKSLPETLRGPLLLRYSHGYSYAEIAKMLNLAEPAVRKRVQRAREKLAAILKEGGSEGDA